jgi:hypothetical protein
LNPQAGRRAVVRDLQLDVLVSFIRRLLHQWGYVRIRDYGLVVTDAGQVIRIADGAIVNALPVPMALPPGRPPAMELPRPTVEPLASPPIRELAAVPAPAFAPPRPAAAPSPPPHRARPPSSVPPPTPPSAPRSRPALRSVRPPPPSASPPPSRRPPPPMPVANQPRPAELRRIGDTIDESTGDATRVDGPRPIGQEIGDPTLVERSPAGSASLRRNPLPRLSARLAARKA